MAILKCKMCGGSLEVSEDVSVATCEYCGTKQTVPKSRDEVVSNLFNRANNLRVKCEFDKAEQVYEKILDLDNTDSEAHWGVVLCKYGIEYVEDPKTYSRIPTCHRTLYEAVITDVNYLAAVENADAEQKELYVAEAKAIDNLQKNILNIVNSEEPFDVFICYKETDENGKRTIDSAITNDIYYQLVQEGFKVFYAPITLEDKLGHEYEPYIFAALNSAKVMLVVGTKPEYFDSVWVRNEWSRFLKSIKNDRSKLLIPCYRDMDVYELPVEFAHLQSQDMGKIGFISDITRGLKKAINSEEPNHSKSDKTKIKKPSKLKKAIDSFKRKRQEKAKFCLEFPLKLFSEIFYFVSVILYFYFGINILINLNNAHDALVFSLFITLGVFIPSLILFKVIKNKILALILQGIVLILHILLCFSDIQYMVKYGFYLFVILSTLLTLIWFVIICFTKRIEKSKAHRYGLFKTNISAIILGVIIIGLLEINGADFLNYELAKGFHNLEEYALAEKLYDYLDNYKDSKSLAKESYKSIINSLDYGEEIYLPTYDDAIENLYSPWKVAYKKSDKVLLILTSPINCEGKSLLGGWKNSDLRKFLNSDFYNGFDKKTKDLILTTNISGDNSSEFFKDKVFILSADETKKYGLKADSSHILRDSVNNTYKKVNADLSIISVEYVDISTIIDDGYKGWSKRIRQESINYSIENPSCCPAIWVDVSNTK